MARQWGSGLRYRRVFRSLAVWLALALGPVAALAQTLHYDSLPVVDGGACVTVTPLIAEELQNTATTPLQINSVSLSVWVSGPSTVTLAAYADAGGSLGSQLASSSLSASVPGAQTLNFSLGFTVAAGSLFWIAATSDDNGCAIIWSSGTPSAIGSIGLIAERTIQGPVINPNVDGSNLAMNIFASPAAVVAPDAISAVPLLQGWGMPTMALLLVAAACASVRLGRRR